MFPTIRHVPQNGKNSCSASAQAAAKDAVIFRRHAPSGSRFRAGQDSRQRRAPQQTRNASGTSTPSDNGSPAPPSRPELLSPSNTRVVTAFLTQTPVPTLPSACRASFPEACVTRVTAHFASNRQEKEQRCALPTAASPPPSALPTPAVSRKALPPPAAKRSAPVPSCRNQRAGRRFQTFRPFRAALPIHGSDVKTPREQSLRPRKRCAGTQPLKKRGGKSPSNH